MPTTVAKFAIAALFVPLGFAQDQARTFYFTQPTAPAAMTAMATLIRTVVDVQNISVDQQHQALVVSGPVDKLTFTEWLFQQLDRPAGQTPSGSAPTYQVGGKNNEVATVYWLPAAATNADLTGLVTAMRTVADVQRLFPYEAQRAIVARGEAPKIAVTDWLVKQIWNADGSTPTGDSPVLPFTYKDGGGNDVTVQIRIFRMDPSASMADLTAMVTAIRTVADIQRLFPYATGRAIIGSALPANMDVAAWLVHELAQPADPKATHQTTLVGATDGVVRVFYLGRPHSDEDLKTLTTEIRTSVNMQRIFPYDARSAVIARGRPDQMPSAEALVAKYSAGPQ